MNKKVIRMIVAVLVAVLVSGTVLLPTTATIFAVEQTADQEQSTPPSENAPKDGGNEHSGHHM
ncbi:MAG: hypothetical protein H6Q68_215 [Firmicutes bacterium]|nr:hypothetical protein [Bacillota bacterium]